MKIEVQVFRALYFVFTSYIHYTVQQTLLWLPTCKRTVYKRTTKLTNKIEIEITLKLWKKIGKKVYSEDVIMAR